MQVQRRPGALHRRARRAQARPGALFLYEGGFTLIDEARVPPRYHGVMDEARRGGRPPGLNLKAAQQAIKLSAPQPREDVFFN